MRILSVILVAAVVGATIGAAIAYVEVRPGASSTGPRRAECRSRRRTRRRCSAGRSRSGRSINSARCSAAPRSRTSSCFATSAKVPLTLDVGSTTCKCTIGNVSNEPIPARRIGQGEARVVGAGESRALPPDGDDSHERSAPARGSSSRSKARSPRRPASIRPTSCSTRSRPATRSRPTSIVMAFAQDELKVSEPEFSNTETRQFFDVSVEPVKSAELCRTPKAKAGVRVRVTTKPGLRLGRFDQWLAVTTNIPDAETDQDPGHRPRRRQHQHPWPDVERGPGRVAARSREEFRGCRSAAQHRDSRRECRQREVVGRVGRSAGADGQSWASRKR